MIFSTQESFFPELSDRLLLPSVVRRFHIASFPNSLKKEVFGLVKFDKSAKYLDNFFISNGDKTVYFNAREIESLKQNLDTAVDPTTGTSTLKCVQYSRDFRPTEVNAKRDSVLIDNGTDFSALLGNGRIELSYEEARDVIEQIGDVVIKNEVVKQALKDLSRT